MSGTLTIRNAEPGDAERIAAIHVASWQATYRDSMPDTYLDSLTVEQRLPMWEHILGTDSVRIGVWVAVADDEISGFCSLGPATSDETDSDGSLELYTIYLDPNHIRQGIGGALLSRAEQEMARIGASMAILWVLEGNEPARRFYEAAGWTSDGTAKQDELFGQTVREVRYSKRLA